MNLKKISVCGILSAFALLSFILENLFPPLFVAGGRIGIANFFVLFAAIVLGFWYGFSALIIKTVLGSVLCGNLSAILYSLPAGVIAYAVQATLILYAPKISVVAASVLGGVINACLQNAAFCIITATPEYFVYIPYLALVGILGGATIGLALFITVRYIPTKVVESKEKE